jgi:hypothetical protein
MTDTNSTTNTCIARLAAQLRSRIESSDSQAERLRLTDALDKLVASHPELERTERTEAESIKFAAQTQPTVNREQGHWPTQQDRFDLERRIRAQQAADAQADADAAHAARKDPA